MQLVYMYHVIQNNAIFQFRPVGTILQYYFGKKYGRFDQFCEEFNRSFVVVGGMPIKIM